MAILERFNERFLEKFKKSPSTDLHRYFHKELFLFLHVKNRIEAIKELIELLVQEKKLSDPMAFYHKILLREKLAMTKIGEGMAVSHAKHESIKDFFIAVGVMQEQHLLWDAEDAGKVKVIFMIGGPENAPTQYLHLLANLTGFIRNKREKLLKMQSFSDLLNCF